MATCSWRCCTFQVTWETITRRWFRKQFFPQENPTPGSSLLLSRRTSGRAHRDALVVWTKTKRLNGQTLRRILVAKQKPHEDLEETSIYWNSFVRLFYYRQDRIFVSPSKCFRNETSIRFKFLVTRKDPFVLPFFGSINIFPIYFTALVASEDLVVDDNGGTREWAWRGKKFDKFHCGWYLSRMSLGEQQNEPVIDYDSSFDCSHPRQQLLNPSLSRQIA